ncbi:MAG: hypothetical protein ACT4QF_18830 [Sporichthyaceae bacterium]
MLEFHAAEIGVEAARRLAAVPGVELGRGLRPEEFDAIEARWGFRFAADHRAFLGGGLPIGQGWPDWRSPDPLVMRNLLNWPLDGLLFDVEHHGYWHPEWAPRPDALADALSVAYGALRRWPVLVPVHGTYYLPAGPDHSGHPVLDVFRSRVVPLGADLADWVDQCYGLNVSGRDPKPTVDYWTALS